MIAWLKQLLRRWLEIGRPVNDSPWIEARVGYGADGMKVARYCVSGSVGFALVGCGEGGDTRLIIEEQAVDAEKFMRLWAKYNEDVELFWADEEGKPIGPAKIGDG